MLLKAAQQEKYERKKERLKRKGRSTAGLDRRYEKISECNGIKARRQNRKRCSRYE